MSDPRSRSIREIFDAVTAASPAERAALLDSLCSDNPDARVRVERLLEADRAASTFLESPAALTQGIAVDQSHESVMIGRSIGRYRIRRLVGTGGMGAVYEAEQENPRRTVALKVIRPGLATSHMLKRFEYETQALGRLRHPGVALIYEAGTHHDPSTDAIWPYFAMEFVAEALPITEYATRHSLSTRDRLAVIAQVCESVQHAHQHGVIHRDLKPANILVDGAGHPKVIDFGVARATDIDVAATIRTSAGQLVGTLQYMSPEQCSAGQMDVDTRSDVYSLGVVMYELLAGTMPYDVKGVPPLEAAKLIREQLPARLRRPGLDDEIDAIAIKALEKDRERRYQSAAEFGADIGRYLRNEPIIARPPTVGYHLRSLARRHRALVAGSAIAAVALVVGVIATSLSLVQALRERDRSRTLQYEAEQEAFRSKRIATFLSNVLASANPYDFGEFRYYLTPESTLSDALAPRRTGAASAIPSRAIDLLRRAGEELPDRFPADPMVRAELALTLGETLTLGGLLQEATPLLRESYATFRKSLGADHLDTVRAAEWLAHNIEQFFVTDESHELREYALVTRRRLQGPYHPETLRAGVALVRSMAAAGKLDDAIHKQEESVERVSTALGADNPFAIEQRVQLASLLFMAERFEEALTQGLAAERDMEHVCGPDSSRTANARVVLSSILDASDRRVEAEGQMRAALATIQSSLGKDSPALRQFEGALVDLLGRQGRFEEMVPYLRRHVENSRMIAGDDHHSTIKLKHMLAFALLKANQDLTTAETCARDSVVGMKRLGEPDRTARYSATLARVIFGRSRPAEALQLADEALTHEQEWFASTHPELTGTLQYTRCLCLTDLRRYDEARAALAKARAEIGSIEKRLKLITVPTEEELAAAGTMLDRVAPK